MRLDFLTIGVGFASFGIFLAIHFITFRWLRPEKLLKSLFACMVAIATLPLVLMGSLYALHAADAEPIAWVMAWLLAFGIAGLLSVAYVLCVFGPYETSVRMRLVREIAKDGTTGVSHQALLERYNDLTIINVRLRRLTGSGDVIEHKGEYRAGTKQNIFFTFDIIAGTLKKWIG